MNFRQSLENLINELPKKQKDVIIQRFGIESGNPKTLAQIGDKYQITRERIRQIEAAGLKALLKKAQSDKTLKAMFDKVIKHLESLGGTRKSDYLIEDLRSIFNDKSLSPYQMELFFGIFEKPIYFLETKNFHSFWYLSEGHLKSNKEFIKKLIAFLKNKKEEVIEKKQFDKLFGQVVKNNSLSDFVALNFVLNSKDFSVNPFGDFGLSNWEEIMPKTVKDKSYLVLKKKREPMHFREIAQEINKIKFDIKKAHPQTVHNELIKDQRFVLVGRGLYSLKEFGIIPGTAREVLRRILKEKGPLPFDKIVKLVGEQRILKHNTILLNLHNKKYFKKADGGLYHLA
ncbi:MAG: sigma factor-like helix-turn-helix DNA-binding protein [Candidatus Paceibacterota bacterium]|jgi:hypothetical protein